VIFHTADFDGLHLVVARNPTEKGPEPVAQFRRDYGATFFGAEDAMVIGADVGHAVYSAVPSGLAQCGIGPALKRRAIVEYPSGTKAFHR